jgi:hypothetical protein
MYWRYGVNYRRVCILSGLAIATVIILSVSSAWPQAPASKATPLIVGTWKLNPEKSNLRLPPDYIEIRQYNLRPDGFLVGLLIIANAQGYHYLQFTARSDGKDYPEYTDQLVADMVATGKQTPRTYSEKIIDDYVTEWTDKVDGKITAQGKKTISKDGKTLMVTVDGAPTSQARIYDRQ